MAYMKAYRLAMTVVKPGNVGLPSSTPSPVTAVHATADGRLYAFMSGVDGGRSWTTFVGYPQQNTVAIDKGRSIYQDNCETCHGVNGVGERPDDPNAQLLETIRDGSPRNERMQAWKDELSDTDINNVIAYMKSLWSFRSLACQGAKHMACMR